MERIRRDLGLDRPLPVQYARFVTRAVRGDLGISIRTGVPVGREILDRLPHTVILAAGGVALAVGLGLVSRPGRRAVASRHRRSSAHRGQPAGGVDAVGTGWR